LADVAFLTNESIFSLKELPRRLLVVGGGPIGMELGQAFRRLGAEVAIVDAASMLGREEAEASAVVTQQLSADGVELYPHTKVIRVEPGPEIVIERAGQQIRLRGTHLLIALGRKPSLDALALDRAGVAADAQGIRTDSSLRSTNKRVYAVGDVAGRGQFTHLAGAHASLVVRRAVFGLPVNADRLVVPRVTFTDPEVASIGLNEAQARDRYGAGVRSISLPFSENDRAQAEGDTRGFAKLVTSKTGKILGATLVGQHAGDHIHFWSLAMSANIKLSKITGAVMPYPTRGEISKRLAGLWYVDALFSSRTRRLVSILKHFA
jgi:pyruvate/2-oxoglutarate dehydrogenase complex dihydrolipoamide dehydrogenase (E3) component